MGQSSRPLVGSLKMNTALEYSTRVVQEGDRRCKKSTLNDLAYLTPLRIPLMNPVHNVIPTYRLSEYTTQRDYYCKRAILSPYPPPHSPASVYPPPPPNKGGGTHLPGGEGGGSIFWKTRDIGLPSYSNDHSAEHTQVVGSLKMNTALEYSTRVVQEGDRRCKKSTLNDLAYLTPLRIPLMNPVKVWGRGGGD
jgi:hypothetical protein